MDRRGEEGRGQDPVTVRPAPINLRIKDSRSLVAGVLFLVVGVGAFVTSRDYPFFGDGNRMGPGAFPMVLSVLLAIMGLIGLLRALTIEGEAMGTIALRPVLAVAVAVASFAFAIDRLGLVVAIAILVPIASLAMKRPRWRETALVTLVLAALSAGLFIYALGLPFTLFGKL